MQNHKSNILQAIKHGTEWFQIACGEFYYECLTAEYFECQKLQYWIHKDNSDIDKLPYSKEAA